MRSAATRETVQDLILDAVDKLLSTRGYKKMTIDELAQEVGIGKGTVYLHFRSKEELTLAHVDRMVFRLVVKLQMIAHGGGPAAERLRQMLIARVLYRFDTVRHYSESLSDVLAAIRPGLLERRERHLALEAKVFAEVLEEGARSGELSAPDARAVSRTLLIATNGLLPSGLTAAALGSRKDVEREASRVADLCLTGLLPRDRDARARNTR